MELRPSGLWGHTLGAGPSLGLGNSSITQNAPAAKIASMGNDVSLRVSAVMWPRAGWWLRRYGLLPGSREIRPHLRKCRATRSHLLLPPRLRGSPSSPDGGLGLEHQCGSQRQDAAAAAASLTSGEEKKPRKRVSYRWSDGWDFGNAVHTPTSLSGVHLCTGWCSCSKTRIPVFISRL